MSTTRIAAALERLEVALGRSSHFGVGTGRSVTTAGEGLRCMTEDGEWRIDADLPGALGGTGVAPNPGVLLRAALGSCMAMTYRLRAARRGIELTSVRVSVETDSKLAGMLLRDASAPPGFTEIRYHVEVETAAPHDLVMQILDEGDQLSPLLDVFARANSMRRTVSIQAGDD